MSDISGEINTVSGEFVDSIEPATQVNNSVDSANRISAQELHKYVIGLVGVFLLFISTYPIAMSRVTQKEKFAPYQFHLKSLTQEYKPIIVPLPLP
jgi:hypothetical protein